MPRTGARTPSIESRILAALRIACRRGLGGLTVAELRTQLGLTGRRSPEIEAACERLVDRGDVVPGWRSDRCAGFAWTYWLRGTEWRWASDESRPGEPQVDKTPRRKEPTCPRSDGSSGLTRPKRRPRASG